MMKRAVPRSTLSGELLEQHWLSKSLAGILGGKNVGTHTHQLKDPGPSSLSHAGGAELNWDASCACSFGSLNAYDVGYFGGQNKGSGYLPELRGENKQHRERPALV